jgi:exonuclease III
MTSVLKVFRQAVIFHALLQILAHLTPEVTLMCQRQNKAKLEDLKEEFQSMFKYILKLSKKETLPAIVAGDNNVKIKNIETLVPPSIVLHKYKRTERRTPENRIDFF